MLVKIMTNCVSLLLFVFSSAWADCTRTSVKINSRLPNGNYDVSFTKGTLTSDFEEDDLAVISRAAANTIAYHDPVDAKLASVFIYYAQERIQYYNGEHLAFLKYTLEKQNLDPEMKKQALENYRAEI